ncbi:Uncharacterized mitochondrial protein AtMg00310 [Linum perenne]
MGGKEVLVKAVLQAVPTYIFSCFLLPPKILKRFKAIVNRFWWGGNKDKRSIHWTNKKILATAKMWGGLGFRDFDCFNRVMLAKTTWRALSCQNALWFKILKGRYFPHTDFLKSKKDSSASWIWGSIWEGKEEMIKGLRKNIGDGEGTWIDDPWIPGHASRSGNVKNGGNRRVRDFILTTQRQWNMPLLRDYYDEEAVKAISCIPIGPLGLMISGCGLITLRVS